MPARFWLNVEEVDGHWLWRGATVGGYGKFGLDDHACLAHRVAYTLEVGPIPDGMTLDHLCRVPECVNPAHLEPATYRENVLRGIGVTATNAKKTHCPKGHPYDILTPRRRICRTCHNAISRAFDARKRASRARHQG